MVQMMVCCLFSDNPLSKPMLGHCQWTLRNKLHWNFNQNKKCIWKYCLPNGCHFVQGVNELIQNTRLMMTSSNGNIFRVTGLLCGEFTGEFPTQRPVTRSFDVFFDLRMNKSLSKQSWGWWSETPSSSLWRHRNAATHCQLVPLFDVLLCI